MSNTFGRLFRLTSFGESHGKAIGGVIDGCPAGLAIDIDFVQGRLDRRKPGQSDLTSQRKESDTIEILSGVFEGKTTGAPIGFTLHNDDSRSSDYDHLKEAFRPSHADYTYHAKYGHRDHRGGGRSSARETAVRVAAGAIAELLLATQGIQCTAWVDQIKDAKAKQELIDISIIFENEVRTADAGSVEAMRKEIEAARDAGDTVGGVIRGRIQGVPAGFGVPVYDRLEADLAKAMLGINASKGFDIGSGFEGATMLGSESNDQWQDGTGFGTKTNHSGGVQGGISNGQNIEFRVAFKAVSTIMQSQIAANPEGEKIKIDGVGRHDPCVLPRAVPVVQAMSALVLADHLLQNRSAKL